MSEIEETYRKSSKMKTVKDLLMLSINSSSKKWQNSSTFLLQNFSFQDSRWFSRNMVFAYQVYILTRTKNVQSSIEKIIHFKDAYNVKRGHTIVPRNS